MIASGRTIKVREKILPVYSAVRWDGETRTALKIAIWIGERRYEIKDDFTLEVVSDDGVHRVPFGHWVIRGQLGVYDQKHFEARFDPIIN